MKLSLSTSKGAWVRRALAATAVMAVLPASLHAADAVAQVDGTQITVEQLRPLFAGLDDRQRAALEKDPAQLNQAIRTFLIQQIVLKEALEKNWDKQAAVTEELQRLRDSVIVQSYLRSLSQPPASFPTDAEVQAAYDANKAALVVPKQMQLAQVFVALPKGADKAATDKAQAKLDAIVKDISAGDFAAVAKASSDEQASAARGGEIGWLAETQIQPGIREAITGLAKSGVSKPIRLDDGWHVIKVLDVKDSHTASLDEVREALAQRLRAERLKANSEAYIATLMQQHPISINELAITKVLDTPEKK
jgi:parvulin-like peptidyl-prolyl isomerase